MNGQQLPGDETATLPNNERAKDSDNGEKSASVAGDVVEGK